MDRDLELAARWTVPCFKSPIGCYMHSNVLLQLPRCMSIDQMLQNYQVRGDPDHNPWLS